MPPTGPNSVILTDIVTEKHPHLWSMPPKTGPYPPWEILDLTLFMTRTQEEQEKLSLCNLQVYFKLCLDHITVWIPVKGLKIKLN